MIPFSFVPLWRPTGCKMAYLPISLPTGSAKVWITLFDEAV